MMLKKLITLSTLITASSFPALGTNLITNGGFESGIQDWHVSTYLSGSATTSTEPGVGISQSTAATIEVDSTDGTSWHVQLIANNNNLISLQANTTYKLKFKVRSNISRLDALTTAVSIPSPYSEIDGSVTTSTTNSWQEVTHIFTPDRDISEARISITLGRYDGAKYYFDDFSIEEYDPGTPVGILNGNFELTNNAGWDLMNYSGSSASMTQDFNNFIEGASSNKISVTTPGAIWTVQLTTEDSNPVNVENGKQYAIRFSAKSTNNLSNSLTLGLAVPSPFAWIGGNTTFNTTTYWTEYEHIFTADQTYPGRITFLLGEYLADHHIDNLRVVELGSSNSGNNNTLPENNCGVIGTDYDDTNIVANADYFVSKNGSDSNDGSSSSPFLTIQKAVDIMQAGDLAYVYEGEYEETILTKASGTLGAPISIYGEPCKVVISGSKSITNWIPHSGNIYKAPISNEVTQLLADNTAINYTKPADIHDHALMTLARFPNRTSTAQGIFESADHDGQNFTHATNNNGVVTISNLPTGDYTDANIYTLGDTSATRWWAVPQKVTSNSGNQLTVMPGNFFLINSMSAYVSGPLHLLDSAGEWAWKDGYLYFWAPNDVDPSTLHVEAKTRGLAFDISHDYIHIENFKVESAAIDITGDNNLVKGIDGRYMTSLQYVLQDERHNKLSDPSAGVRIEGDNNLLSDSSLYYNAGEAVTVHTDGQHNTIDNNDIAITSYLAFLLHGITLEGDYNRVIGNNIHKTGKENIRILPNGQQNDILYNDITGSGYVAHDLGQVVLWGVATEGTEIAYNWIHDNRSGSAAGANHAIYLDNNNKDVLIHHNVIWNTRGNAIRFNSPQYNIYVYNNSIGDSDERIGQGIFFNSSLTDQYTGLRVQNVMSNVNFANNYMFENTAFPRRYLDITYQNQVVNPDNSEFYDFSKFSDGSYSPKFEAGTLLNAVTFNSNGTTRTFPSVNANANGIPEVGAYESGGVAWTAGVNRVEDN